MSKKSEAVKQEEPAAVLSNEQLDALRSVIQKELSVRRVYEDAAHALEALDLLNSSVTALARKKEVLEQENAKIDELNEEAAQQLSDYEKQGVELVSSAQTEASKIIDAAHVKKSEIEAEASATVVKADEQLLAISDELGAKKKELEGVNEELTAAQATLAEIRSKLQAI